MFTRQGHRRLITRLTASGMFVALILTALIAVQAAGLGTVRAGQGGSGRQMFDTMGDKDDLPTAPTTPVSCTRAAHGQGIIRGKITDVKTGQPVANAYIGVSPGLVNSFACYTYSQADGTFAIDHLPPGTYNLSASRWKVNGTDPLYRDSIVRQIPIGNSIATVQVALTPLAAPGFRVIGQGDARNLIIVDMDETYYNAWFTDQNSVANPKLTPAMHGIARQGVTATEDWTQYGFSPIDHYQLATGAYPAWRTPDAPAPYWTEPSPNLDTNLWYSGSATNAEEFGQESIFDVAKSYGMNTAIIGGNDYPSGHITDANIDEIHLNSNNPCSAPYDEIKSMENFINQALNNPNGFLLYAPLTQAEGFNTENTSPDAPPSKGPSCTDNNWSYTQASIWDDQAFGALLKYLSTTRQGSSTLLQDTTIIVTSDEAENDLTNFDNFYPTQPGEPGLGSTRHIPFVIEGPNIYRNKVYRPVIGIDDTSVNAMASLGLPAPEDSRGKFIPAFFIVPPKVPLPPIPPEPIPSQGYVPLVENNVNGYTTTIEAQNESTAPATQVSIVVLDRSGKVVANQPLKAPFAPDGAWVINAGSLGLPQGFVGSAVLRADEPLAIVSTATPATPNAPTDSFEGYIGATTGSALDAPIVLDDVNGVTSHLAISNLSPCKNCTTTVAVRFYGANGNLLTQTSAKVAPYGQFIVDASKVGMKAGTTASAVIVSSPPQPLAATVSTTAVNGTSFTFDALSAGDTALTAPLVYNAVNGQTTSLAIQNTGKATANVAITYRDTSGNTVATQTPSIPAHGFVTESASSAGLPTPFTGSAAITADQKVAVTAQISTSTATSAYNAVRTMDYTLYTPVYIPLVENDLAGVTSAVTVTNTGTQTTTAQIQYFTDNGNADGSTPTASLAPGASYTFNQGDPSSGLQDGFVGTAYLTSSANQHLAVTVTLSGNGVLQSYNGGQAQTGQLILTIAQLRQHYNVFNNQLVTVTNAIVTRNFGSNWFIQDNTGGIRVYIGGGVNEQIGDIETVTGVLTNYSGEIEIDPESTSDVIKTGSGQVPNPVVVTTQQIAQLKYTDLIDGELATIPLSTITTYTPPSLGLTDSSNVEATAYFDSYALKNINLSNFSQGEQVVTTGVLAMYGSGLGSATGEIEPLLTSDFVQAQR